MPMYTDGAVSCDVPTDFTFSPCKLYEKFIDAISRLMRPKMKQFAVKCRRILEVLRIQGLQKEMKQTFYTRQQLHQFVMLLVSYNSHTECVSEPQFATIAIYAVHKI